MNIIKPGDYVIDQIGEPKYTVKHQNDYWIPTTETPSGLKTNIGWSQLETIIRNNNLLRDNEIANYFEVTDYGIMITIGKSDNA